MVYGFIIAFFGTLATFTTMGELASMYALPTTCASCFCLTNETKGANRRRSISLGLNACSSVRAEIAQLRHRYAPSGAVEVCGLRPDSSRIGWLTVTGWQAIVASGGYLCGTLIQGLIVLNNPTYTFERWHGTLLFWAVLFLAFIINTVLSSLLPKFEVLILLIHTLGFFVILIPLVHLAPHGTTSDVFKMFINGGGWPTMGLSFFVGLLGTVFSFLGSFPLPASIQ